MSKIFVESVLSATIKTALEAAGVGLPVITFWGAEPEGTVKTDELDKIAVLINVRDYEDLPGVVANLQGVISIEIHGAGVRTLGIEFKKVVDVLEAWQDKQDDGCQLATTALTTPGFKVDCYKIGSGNVCGVDPAGGVYFAVLNFEITGHHTKVIEPEPDPEPDPNPESTPET